MADHGSESDAIGGSVRHIPVMLAEVLEHLAPAPGKTILDGTFGAGGYTRAILERGADVIALDRDPNAIAAGAAMVAEFPGRLTLRHSNFGRLDGFAPEGGLDGVVLDIGVSSMQIDEAERGFSFQRNGPLDMRMSSEGVSAADVVNRARVNDLIRIFGLRADRKFATTRDLVSLIEMVNPRRATDKIHPATRVFQALRIYVNNELGELVDALFAAERALKPGGRLVVVSFHSLEDRIVKRFFADRAGRASGSRHLPEVSQTPQIFDLVTRQAISAGDEEAETNPRARSAKLRAGIRTPAKSGKADPSIFDLPQLTDIERMGG